MWSFKMLAEFQGWILPGQNDLIFMNSSHFSPKNFSPGLISPELFLQQIIIPEHNSPVRFISRNKVLQLIINLRLFYAKDFSPEAKFSENKYLHIHSSPRSNYPKYNFLHVYISPGTKFIWYKYILGRHYPGIYFSLYPIDVLSSWDIILLCWN